MDSSATMSEVSGILLKIELMTSPTRAESRDEQRERNSKLIAQSSHSAVPILFYSHSVLLSVVFS